MMKQQTILIVDDEIIIREVVRKYLELDGFAVVEAESGSQALGAVRNYQPDLVVLDIMLPGRLNGFELARSLRADDTMSFSLNTDIPIILLTGRTGETDRIAGFEVGADDYVVKPFSPRELAARVKAILRRSSAEITGAEAPITIHELHLDPGGRTVKLKGEPIFLTTKEFDLLWFFARHPRQVFSRTQLLDNVWGYEFYGDESTVTVHVRRLREKVEPDPASPIYIQTVWGVGYKFEAPGQDYL